MSSDAGEEVEVNETVLQKLFHELDALPDSHMALSSKAGLNPRFFSQLRKKRSILNVPTFIQIVMKLDLDPMKIMGFSQGVSIAGVDSPDQKSSPIHDFGHDYSIDDVLKTWTETDGLMTRFDEDLVRHVVVFRPPEEKMPIVHAVGEESLTNELLQTKGEEGLQAMIDRSETFLTEQVASSHFKALQGVPILTIESGRHVWAGGVSAVIDYARLLLPVRDETGHMFIINFSKKIRAR